LVPINIQLISDTEVLVLHLQRFSPEIGLRIFKSNGWMRASFRRASPFVEAPAGISGVGRFKPGYDAYTIAAYAPEDGELVEISWSVVENI
jgi:hypothetical protein